MVMTDGKEKSALITNDRMRWYQKGLEFRSKGTGECGGLWKIVKWDLCGGILEISMEGIPTVFC